MRVAGIQPTERLGDVAGTVADMQRFAASAERAGARIICFPEAYLQGYVNTAEHLDAHGIAFESADFERVLAGLAGISATIVFGLIERGSDGFYNSAAIVRDGELLGSYSKNRLLRGESLVYQPGEPSPVFEVDDVRFGINICNDLNFADCASGVADQGASLLVCPCNNMFPEPIASDFKDRHNPIRAERCREAGLWLVSSEVTGTRDDRIALGPTAVIDPDGEVVAQAPLGVPGMVLFDVPAGKA